MVLIIILSFSNFYYIINGNFIDSNDTADAYFSAYTGFILLDPIISVYCLGALGDFDTTIYMVGKDRYIAMGMFLISTFVISVVFMNMLIAIMG